MNARIDTMKAIGLQPMIFAKKSNTNSSALRGKKITRNSMKKMITNPQGTSQDKIGSGRNLYSR
jgi:hypothetical protein